MCYCLSPCGSSRGTRNHRGQLYQFRTGTISVASASQAVRSLDVPCPYPVSVHPHSCTPCPCLDFAATECIGHFSRSLLVLYRARQVDFVFRVLSPQHLLSKCSRQFEAKNGGIPSCQDRSQLRRPYELQSTFDISQSPPYSFNW
jgi:hypothetical protein